ncbi:hypothetical protein Q5H93_01960 [Hymenobacter sp. ASUV-10]|uniref:Carboxypeptidase regulatory-like domain-containing protein n=1 Tax=Hymenobacter aranciens TaxID=3063996 RepID=A0ABT9B5C9_9BACT|nr:hypothetical protein [Hymenobacter sp. ASUV-10]MDO7873479.1 hypothetical protein [Hymenobacter sp. ASUV-10]
MRFFTLASLLFACLFALATSASAARTPAKGPVAKMKTVSSVKTTAKAKVAAPKTLKTVDARPVAPKFYTFTGIVLGQNGLPLPGTSVIPTGKLSAMVVTNEDGIFSVTLPAAEAANVNLKFAYAGLGDWNVKVKGGQKSPVLVTMLPAGM